MIIASLLYLVALFLIVLFTGAVFGVSAQSLAYVPLTLALVVLLHRGLTTGPRDFLRLWYSSSPTIIPALLFLAGLAASMPQAVDLGLAARDFLRWTFVWLVFAPVTRALCSSRERCRLFARALPILVAGFAALAVATLLTGSDLALGLFGISGVSPQERYQSIYENAGIFAGMLIVGFPLALVPALTERCRGGRLTWGLGAAIMVGGMLLSGSRAAVASAAVAALVAGAALRRRRVVAVAGAVITGAAALTAAGHLTELSALARYHHIMEGRGTGARSLQRRAYIWSRASELIAENPVIGLGGSQLRFHQYSTFNRAHNAWLDAWLDGGILAFGAMLIVTGTVVRRCLRTLSGRVPHYLDPTHVALVASCAAVLAGWTVRAGIGSRIDWLPLFMLLSLYWERPDRDAPDDESRAARAAAPGAADGRGACNEARR